MNTFNNLVSNDNVNVNNDNDNNTIEPISKNKKKINLCECKKSQPIYNFIGVKKLFVANNVKKMV